MPTSTMGKKGIDVKKVTRSENITTKRSEAVKERVPA